jgi:guanyl-specific ribonuclease Sa
MHALARRVARLEQCAATVQPGACPVRAMDQSPEEGAAVLALLLEVGALRYADDGTLLRLGNDGGYEVLCPQ